MKFGKTFELNNAVTGNMFRFDELNEKSPIVEVFSYMAKGKPVGELNGKLKNSAGVALKSVDPVVDRIKELASYAARGDNMAAVELNEVRRYNIEPSLMEALKLLEWMGSYKNLGYNESIEITTREHVGEKSRVQAGRGDVVFPTQKRDKYTVSTVTISGGYAVDYRKIQNGDMSEEHEGMQQVQVDMRNKAARYVIYTIFNALTNAAGVNFVEQGAGLTQTALDSILRRVRRFGRPGITGDYSVVSQINAFHGYVGADGSVVGVSERALDILRRSGLIGMYNGSVVNELENAFDETRPLADGSGFETLFPESLLFITPSGMKSPVRTWTRGGLTSFVGPDVNTGTLMTRYDLEVAADVEKGKEHRIGMYFDTSLGAPEMPV